jgi:hypothetical protein
MQISYQNLHSNIITAFPRTFNPIAFYKGTRIIGGLRHEKPVTVAVRSRACTVFARSEAGIVDSNPTQGMDV